MFGIKLLEVKPNYSSAVGNLVYRELGLPDMVLSSIEISRRAYEFNLQFILKAKEQVKNIIFPLITESIKDKVKHSLEEIKCFIDFDNWKELYLELKKSKVKYRFPLDSNVFESKTLKFTNTFM